MRVALDLHLIRRLIIPILALLLVHLFVYQKLPFQEGYQFPVASFLAITLVGVMICEVNAGVHKYLGARWPLAERTRQRLAWQLLGGMLGTAIVFTILYLAINQGYSGLPFRWVHFLAFLLLMLGISLIENTVFLLADYYQLYKRQKEEREQTLAKQVKASVVVVKSGARTLRLHPDEIAFFVSREGIISLVSQEGKWITTDFKSLTELETQYGFLFRLNRQHLIHPQAVQSLKEVENRKLEVRLIHSSATSPIIVSRYKRSTFKDWLAATTSSSN